MLVMTIKMVYWMGVLSGIPGGAFLMWWYMNYRRKLDESDN